jgi:hypothetical protein
MLGGSRRSVLVLHVFNFFLNFFKFLNFLIFSSCVRSGGVRSLVSLSVFLLWVSFHFPSVCAPYSCFSPMQQYILSIHPYYRPYRFPRIPRSHPRREQSLKVPLLLAHTLTYNQTL